MPEVKENLVEKIKQVQSLDDSIDYYLSEGFSLIPVNGKVPPNKWKLNQSKRNSKQELSYAMDNSNAISIAIVGGNVSDNTEFVDVDVKWYPGLADLVLNALRETNPELAKKLRVHKTPSGGIHLLYKITDQPVPKSKKIAKRKATPEELLAKPDETEKCLIETKGEAGYVVAPPSSGYTVLQDVPVPKITWAERNEIHAICKIFDQTIKEDTKNYAPARETEYYDENPFEDYNMSNAGEHVLPNNAWKINGQDGVAIRFTRPDSKTGGCHAVFLKATRLYYFFTTNSQFDNDRCYQPATVRAELEFKGDKKRLWRVLVGEGYGKLNPDKERSIVKNKAAFNQVLPPNVSESAKEQYTTLVNRNRESHPYGTGWEISETDKVIISRTDLYGISEGLGFGLLDKELVQIVGYEIQKRNEHELFNALIEYVKEPDPVLHKKICDELETFFQKSGGFTLTRLKEIPRERILKDSKDNCFKFFKNGYLNIKVFEISWLTYEVIGDKLVLAEKIQQRDYVPGCPLGKYREFLNHGVRYEQNREYIDKIIGNLAHDYKDTATPYITVLTEEVPNPKLGGGTGKNLFSTLFNYTTTSISIPGAQVSYDSKFMQSWSGERIFAISDVPEKFNYLFLKEPSSGSGIVKKLFKDERNVPVEKMPKFIVGTNYSYKVSDGGLKRRIIPLEFTDFFTKKGGVDVFFGCQFPDGWTQADWSGYDSIITHAIQAWLRAGRKMEPKELTEGGWTKKFDHEHWEETRNFFEEYWPVWTDNASQRKDGNFFVSARKFKKDYAEFCDEYDIKVKKSPKPMNNALEDWCKHFGYEFDHESKNYLGAGLYERGKWFIPIVPF